ncbi:MAG: LptE family protein [Bacteroidetes bacterium]|nr:LptE family protein [Bacteroidota bacterium]MCB9227160.1 LptE family protein [Chitinophagales bacterium]
MRILVAISFIVVTLSACKVYSFTGASINPNIRTISVQYISDKSGNSPATASDIFTNTLKEKMLNATSLSFVNNGGDVEFDGFISSYNYSIQAPTGTLTSDLRRITMQVSITYINNVEEESGFETQTFSRFADYPVDEDLSSVEENIIREISEQLADDIFNKAFVNW